MFLKLVLVFSLSFVTIMTSCNIKEVNKNSYNTSESSYTHNSIKIAYPQISGLGDENKQKQINELIKDEAIKGISLYDDEVKATVEMNYEIKYKSANLLSIIYTGILYVDKAAYPINMFYTTNIDITNGNRIMLKDFINIDDDFIEKVKNAEFITQSPEIESEKEYIIKTIGDFNLTKELKNADGSIENTLSAYSYFAEDSLGISFGVIHALGDHVEFEIDYDDLKDNINPNIEFLN